MSEETIAEPLQESPTSEAPASTIEQPAQTEQPAQNKSLLSTGAEVGKQESSWLESIDKEYLSSQAIANAQSPNDLAKQIVNLEKVMGKPKLPMPQDDWKEEQWNEFYQKLGRPDTTDGYDLNYKSETFNFADEDKAQFQKAFYEAGLSKDQATKVFNAMAQREESFAKSIEEKTMANHEQLVNNLKAEWGDNFDNNIKLANFALQKLAGDKAEQLEQRYGDDPEIVNILYKAGAMLQDDSEFRGELKSNSWTSPVAAQGEIAQLKTNGEFMGALMNESHPAHKEAVAKWSNLHNVAYS